MTMTKELFALIVGIIGNVTSTIVFASPVITFWRIVKKRNTEGFSPVPYVMCMMSQVLWVYYGLLKPNGLIIVSVSALGFLFELVYLSIFLLFASFPQKLYAIKLTTISTIAFVALFLGTFLGSRGTRRLNIVGFLCAINSVCMYASPLSIMKKVVTTKSVEYMPFFLTFSLFVSGGTWTTYSILIRDLFMAVSSGTGFFCATFQLVLYGMFYKRKPHELQESQKSCRFVKNSSKDESQNSVVKIEEFISVLKPNLSK